jgi:uncharacterized protein (TIGR03083 family)
MDKFRADGRFRVSPFVVMATNTYVRARGQRLAGPRANRKETLMPDLMPMVHAERHALADFLDTLAPAQWTSATWCEKWNVQDLVGHLTAAGNITAPHFFSGLVRTGFSFNRFVEGDLREYAAGTPADVRGRFDKILDSDRKPPGPAYVALGEVMVHGEDIRRPLGARGDHPADHLTTLAELYKKTGAPLRAKKRLDGLRLQATDVDWSTGTGPEVTGPCMSLIMAMVGRTGALADCEGPGVETLRARS